MSEGPNMAQITSMNNAGGGGGGGGGEGGQFSNVEDSTLMAAVIFPKMDALASNGQQLFFKDVEAMANKGSFLGITAADNALGAMDSSMGESVGAGGGGGDSDPNNGVFQTTGDAAVGVNSAGATYDGSANDIGSPSVGAGIPSGIGNDYSRG